MDKVRYTSLKLKLWEDKIYKLEKQRQHIHLDEIKLDIQKKATMDSEQIKKAENQQSGHKYFSDQNKLMRKDSNIISKTATEFYAPGHHQPYAKKASKKHIDQNEVPFADLIGECYIGFSKLLNDEMKAFDIKDSALFDTLKVASFNNKNGTGSINGKTSQEEITKHAIRKQSSEILLKAAMSSNLKKKQFSEKLWFCGNSIGEISGNLTFFNLPILYQMKVGVLTKSGIQFSSKPILLESQMTSQRILKDENNPLKRLEVLKDKLILSDTGKVKQRLTLYEKMQIF